MVSVGLTVPANETKRLEMISLTRTSARTKNGVSGADCTTSFATHTFNSVPPDTLSDPKRPVRR